jgi:hypothetical protein
MKSPRESPPAFSGAAERSYYGGKTKKFHNAKITLSQFQKGVKFWAKRKPLEPIPRGHIKEANNTQ